MAPIVREVIYKAKVGHIDYGLNLFNILNTHKGTFATTFIGLCGSPQWSPYKTNRLFRLNEIIICLNEIIIRSNEIIICLNNLIFRLNELVIRLNELVFRYNELVFHFNELIFRLNELVFCLNKIKIILCMSY